MMSNKKYDAYQNELFARGYIFSEVAPEGFGGDWIKARFGDFYLAHDPRLHYQRGIYDKCEVACLGVICDVRRPLDNAQDCVSNLVRALARSERSFFKELGFTCGRYVIAYKRSDGSYFIVSDATGMMRIFYYLGSPKMISSHHNLLFLNAENGEWNKKLAVKRGYPGLRTPLEKALRLTPNTKLGMADFSVTRFWPDKPVEENSVEVATDIVYNNMKGVISYVLNKCNPVVSITGGLDSRLTLSFFRDKKNIRYFTYYRDDGISTDAHDLEFARTAMKRLGLDIFVINLDDFSKPDREFVNILRKNTSHNHLRSVAWAYYKTYAHEPGVLHLRSNISEIGREFWRKKSFPVKRGSDLARVYLSEKGQYKPSYFFKIIELFEEFDDVTGITRCANFVDIKSLFYWEFRMSSWHSEVVAESDPAFDTLSLFNCRNTLEAMLSVSVKERENATILRNIITRNWQELSNFKVNGQPFYS